MKKSLKKHTQNKLSRKLCQKQRTDNSNGDHDENDDDDYSDSDNNGVGNNIV